MDEHLVIETRGHKAAQLAFTAPTSNSRLGQWFWLWRQPVEQFGGGHALVRLKRCAFAHVHQAVGLFRTGGHDPARAVVFERAPTSIWSLASNAEASVSPFKAPHALPLKENVIARFCSAGGRLWRDVCSCYRTFAGVEALKPRRSFFSEMKSGRDHENAPHDQPGPFGADF